jgi:hypothetical protein
MRATVNTHNINRQDISMTVRQIKKKVGEAWAILKNPVFDEKEVLLSAELLYYDADKEKALEQLSKCKNGHFAFFFFGTMNLNQVYLLNDYSFI